MTRSNTIVDAFNFYTMSNDTNNNFILQVLIF